MDHFCSGGIINQGQNWYYYNLNVPVLHTWAESKGRSVCKQMLFCQMRRFCWSKWIDSLCLSTQQVISRIWDWLSNITDNNVSAFVSCVRTMELQWWCQQKKCQIQVSLQILALLVNISWKGFWKKSVFLSFIPKIFKKILPWNYFHDRVLGLNMQLLKHKINFVIELPRFGFSARKWRRLKLTSPFTCSSRLHHFYTTKNRSNTWGLFDFFPQNGLLIKKKNC